MAPAHADMPLTEQFHRWINLQEESYRFIVLECVPVDWIGRSSIGAVMGVSIAQYAEPALVINKVRAAFVEVKPSGGYTLPVVSLLSGKRMYLLSMEFMPGNIEDLEPPFFAVSSNINTAEINLHESGPIWRVISASV